MKVISSPNNKYIKLATSLKHRKYRNEQGMFLVEGKRAVQEAQAKPGLVEVIFADINLTNQELTNVDTEISECYLLEPGLMRQVCSTENPQGIAAILRKPIWLWEDLVDKKGLLILLDRIADPGNLGSILRTCWAFGVAGVLMTRGSVDLFSPKVVRSTMGAILNVPVFTDINSRQMDSLYEQGYKLLCTDVNQGEKYYSVSYGGATIITIGSESQGVSEELKTGCDRFINIPMKPGVDSLNVASACAIIVAEAWRQYQEITELA